MGYYYTNNSIEPLNHCEDNASEKMRCNLKTLLNRSLLDFGIAFCLCVLVSLISFCLSFPPPLNPAHPCRRPTYYASFSKSGDAPRVTPGPGRSRVLRALAFCQIQQGLYRDALRTSRMVLYGDGTGDSGGAKEEGDAAMLMLRADALVRAPRRYCTRVYAFCAETFSGGERVLVPQTEFPNCSKERPNMRGNPSVC